MLSAISFLPDFKSYDSRSNFLLWIVACSVILPPGHQVRTNPMCITSRDFEMFFKMCPNLFAVAALLECVILIITVVPAQKTNRGQSNCKSCEIVSKG